MLRSLAAADFCLQHRLETAGILSYFKVENGVAGKKIKAKPVFSIWYAALSGFSFEIEEGKKYSIILNISNSSSICTI